MNPSDASVYSDTWSPTTWAIVLAVIVVGVITLMLALIAGIHRSIEKSVQRPEPGARAVDGAPAGDGVAPAVETGEPGAAPHHPAHAA